MKRVTEGAEAARIQAEASQRAKYLRETAYKQVMARVQSISASVQI